MASLRGHTHVASSAATVDVAVPSGTQVGDVMLLFAAGYFESDTTGRPSNTTTDAWWQPTTDLDANWAYFAPYDAFDFSDTFDPPNTFETFALVKRATADDIGGTVSFTTSANNGLHAVLAVVEGVALNVFATAGGDYWTTSAPENPEIWTFGPLKGFALAFGVWAHDGSTPCSPSISRGTNFVTQDDGTLTVLATGEAITQNYYYPFLTSGESTTPSYPSIGITFGADTSIRDAIGWYHFVVVDTSSIDNFADAEPVVISSDLPFVSNLRKNGGYTTETGEPHIGGSEWAQARSAWWIYQPIDSGTATLVANSDYIPVVDVFEGSTLGGLTWLDDNVSSDPGDAIGFTAAPEPNNYTGSMTIDVTAGNTYYIRESAHGAEWFPSDTYIQLTVIGPATMSGGGVTVTAVPIAVEVAELPVTPIYSNDYFALATPVAIATDNAVYTSATIDNTGYGKETGEPTGGSNLFHTAWWKYSPLHTGSATFTTTGSAPATGDGLDLEIHVYQGATLTDLVQAGAGRSIDDDDDIARATFTVYAGHTYYVQVGDGSSSLDGHDVVLTVQGPRSTGDATVAVDAPPINTAVAQVAVPPIRLAAGSPSPDDGAVLPTAHPSFSLTIARSEPEPYDVLVVVTVATNGGLNTVTTISKTVTLSYYSNVVTLTVPDNVTLSTGTTYYWEIAVYYDGDLRRSWFWKSFTIAGTSSTTTTTPVTWTVTAGSPSPHLWFVYPAAGKPGDSITAVGLGAADGTVTVNGTPATITSFTQVAATSATTGRRIDPYTGAADAEHFAVVFTVPNIDAPGGPVVVTS